jgi:hypothetical protein
MISVAKRLRVLALMSAVFLTSASAALAAVPGVDTSSSAPAPASSALPPPTDCISPCMRLLQPQQKVTVGAPRYAFASAAVNATADGFGADFAVRYSPNGYDFTKIYDSGPGTTTLGMTFNMPGYYRIVASNPATAYFTTKVAVNINPS